MTTGMKQFFSSQDKEWKLLVKKIPTLKENKMYKQMWENGFTTGYKTAFEEMTK